MTRSDLVERLAERFDQLTQRDTEAAVKAILDAMADALARGHRIEIRGFGSFSINRRPPRIGRNPRSGEQVVVPLNEANPALGHLEPPHEPGDTRPRLEIAFGVNADRWLIATVKDLKTRKVLMNAEPVARLL